MHVFRLWQTGFPDRLIAFDSLPDELLERIDRGNSDGLPRHWGRWLADNSDGRFYLLDYINTNKDKEKWEIITNYVRKQCDASIRLLDKMSDMARPMAPDSKSEVSIEPEDIPVIPMPKTAPLIQEAVKEPPAVVVKEIETKSHKPQVIPQSKLKHSCSSKGHGGMLAEIGTCPRCDELRSRKLVPA